jgi:copper(I)-binding protein
MKTVTAAALLAVLCTAAVRASTAPIVVSNVWSRPATGTAVVYATIANHGTVADKLIGATSPVATRVELHESSETKMPGMQMSMGNMPMSGSMMSMQPVASIPVPARGTATLAPGGYHLMLDLRHDIHAGETIPLRLHFARAGWIDTSTYVRSIK